MNSKYKNNLIEMSHLTSRIEHSLPQLDALFNPIYTNREPITEIHIDKINLYIQAFEKLKELMRTNISLQNEVSNEVQIDSYEQDALSLSGYSIDLLDQTKSLLDDIGIKQEYIYNGYRELSKILSNLYLSANQVMNWYVEQNETIYNYIDFCRKSLNNVCSEMNEMSSFNNYLNELDSTTKEIVEYFSFKVEPVLSIEAVVIEPLIRKNIGAFINAYNSVSEMQNAIINEISSRSTGKKLNDIIQEAEKKKEGNKQSNSKESAIESRDK